MVTDKDIAIAEIKIAIEERPSNRAIKDKIIEEIRPTLHDFIIYQDRPNTLVSFKIIYKGNTLETFAFTKANWPDRWRAEYGIELAIEKAFSKAARVLMEDPNPATPIVENRNDHHN